jgi:porin
MNHLAAVLAAGLLLQTFAIADEATTTDLPWMQWDLATGDWYRNRALIEDQGVRFLTTYTSQIWGNVAGGIRTGATYTGLLQFGAEIDFEKLLGWHGLSFNTTWIWIEGGNSTTDLTGTLFPVSGTEAPNGLRALDLWLEQKLFDDRFTMRAGMFNADRDFTVSDVDALFLNSAFGWPILYDGTLGGPPAYPFAAPGLFAAVEPGDGWKIQAAALQGSVWPPDDNPTGFYWRFDRMNGILFLGETHYAWQKAPLPGIAKLGVMTETGYPDYVGTDGEAWGGTFFYGIIDQWLWREANTNPDAPQGIAWFTRAGLTGTPDRSPLGALFNSGFTWTGLIPTRDEDAAGIALVWARLTPGQTSGLEGSGRGNEFVIETTYQAQLTPFFSIQPDLQLLVQPGGNPAVPDALVLGLSANIDF